MILGYKWWPETSSRPNYPQHMPVINNKIKLRLASGRSCFQITSLNPSIRCLISILMRCVSDNYAEAVFNLAILKMLKSYLRGSNLYQLIWVGGWSNVKRLQGVGPIANLATSIRRIKITKSIKWPSNTKLQEFPCITSFWESMTILCLRLYSLVIAVTFGAIGHRLEKLLLASPQAKTSAQ